MPICPSGARPKSGQPEFFIFSPITLPPPFNSLAGWLTTALLNLPNTPVRTSEFCAQEPSGDLPTTQDWISLAFPAIAYAQGTYTRLANFVKQQEYSDRCECVSASGAGCTSATSTIEWAAGSPTSSICGPNTYYVEWPTSANRFPTGQHTVRVRINIVTTHDVQFDIYTASIGERCFTWLAGTAFDITFSGNLTDTEWNLAFRDNNANPLWLLGAAVQLDYSNATGEPPCSGLGTPIPAPQPEPPPTGLPGPPSLVCSTIADVCTLISALSMKLDQVVNVTNILQRWGKPFGYIAGAEHPDLSGTGSIPISRLLGMRVYVVTPPPDRPVLPGNPPYLWDVGWMAITNADGMLEEHRITRSGFDWTPVNMPLAESFNYSLNPGVVLTVIEMRPEP